MRSSSPRSSSNRRPTPEVTRLGSSDSRAGEPSFGRSVTLTHSAGPQPADAQADGDCDDEFVAAAADFIKRQHAAGTPFFCWVNTTHMHLRTHTKPESVGQAGRWQSEYHDTMVDHDKHIGELLDLIDELGLGDDTVVMYSTDNGT